MKRVVAVLVFMVTVVAIAIYITGPAFNQNSDVILPQVTMESTPDEVPASNLDVMQVEPDNTSVSQSTTESGLPDVRHENAEDLEDYFVVNGSVSAGRLMELRTDETFDDLVAQLRGQVSDAANRKRSEYELLFYSQPLATEGSVMLDTIECGTALCIAELRASDQEHLDLFIENITNSSDFEGRAVIQLPGSSIRTSDPTERLVFPHESEIDSITLPADFFGTTGSNDDAAGGTP